GIDYISAQYFGFVFLFIAAGFVRQVSKGVRLLPIYIILYIGLHLFLPYTTYDRYITILLPFFLLYLITEIYALVSVVQREFVANGNLIKKFSAGFIGLALLTSIGITLYNYSSGIYWRLTSTPFDKSARPAIEDTEAINWINTHTDLSDVIVCTHDSMYFLYTGRKATRFSAINLIETSSFQNRQLTSDEQAEIMLRILGEFDARYLIITSKDFEDQPILQQKTLNSFLELHSEKLLPVFRSSDGNSV